MELKLILQHNEDRWWVSGEAESVMKLHQFIQMERIFDEEY